MIYLLEDDQNIRKFVLYALESVGFESMGFGHPGEFWDAMDKRLPTLLLLDIMLPGESGIEILTRLRKEPKTARLPVIMLTAKGSEYDKVVGLDTGAAEQITHPFGTTELISRERAGWRRCGAGSEHPEDHAGILTVCPARHTVRVGEQEVNLTVKEFELLCLLIQNRGRVFTRDQILQKIWGYYFDGESRTVDVHIKTLRAKLGPAAELIETVRGVGYKIGD